MSLKKKLLVLIIILLFIIPTKLFAQDSQFSGWIALFHTQRLSEHWGYSFDGQLRSSDKFGYLKNVLIRPAANYYFAKNKVVALGYAYFTTDGRTAAGNETFRPENRIWEQYLYTHKLGKSIAVSHRFRLEQRFLGETAANKNDEAFAQRFRYYIRGIIPFKNDSAVFNRGLYLALQNEIFVNVQNLDKVNTHFFDQNRAYIGLGYRLSKKVDVEIAYLNQYSKQAKTYTVNNVAHLAFYTRL
ncbi:MAG: hypothetical protein JWR38_4498 [Mucilaginibacter sp.]|nr:hypothetical protein [Mucilaginibacter sp.]